MTTQTKRKIQGSLRLDWYLKTIDGEIKSAKNYSVITTESKQESDIPAPQINWVNKEDSLLYDIDPESGKGNKPYFVDKNDIRVKETRQLIHKATYSTKPIYKDDNPGALIEEEKQVIGYEVIEDTSEQKPQIPTKAGEGLLIKGDNLLALNSLKKMFAGKPDSEKVKCIYIDPPYNTGSAFEHYDDNLAHSEWLSMMRDRLVILRDLLRDDGVIFVQCDDSEQAYLKVLLDEVFGRGNFVKTIHIQMSIVQGEKVRAAKQGNIVKNGEYIHVFSKNGNKKIGIEPLYDPSVYDTHYSIYIDENYNEKPVVEFCLENKEIKKLLELAGLAKKDKLTNNNLARAYNEIPKFRDFIHENAERIVRTHTMIEIDEARLETNLQENRTYIYKHSNREYLYGIDSKRKIKQRFRLSDKLKSCNDYYNTYQISNMRGDWWAGFHIDMGNINKESEKNLDDGQKPERLIQNIIKFTTNPNDLVLDCFGGSGTTFAVATKMNRRWIGVELGNHAETIEIPRLKKVLSGQDQGGVSKALSWKGGSSFQYCVLGESVLDFGEGDFRWNLGRNYLQENLLSSYDFILTEAIEYGNKSIDGENEYTFGIIETPLGIAVGIASLDSTAESEISFDSLLGMYEKIESWVTSQNKTLSRLGLYTNRFVQIEEEIMAEKMPKLALIKVPFSIFNSL